ncbi:MAG: ABC transporter permease [Gammaproteobacteria bacterium]|nr:MAG: ABC transporter permease [Gammaproteobacteria bacterium]
MNNPRGMWTLFRKEMSRFMKVSVQTVLTPVVTSLLYLMVFLQVLKEHVEVYPGVVYSVFLLPGLIMMSMIQNAFANSSSSLIQSKMMGNLVFVLLAPLSSLEIYFAFVAAAILRGLLVGIGVYIAAIWFVPLHITNIGVVLVFALLGTASLGALGLLAGIWSRQFEQLAAFQNFVVLPLSFLSGVFYSIHSLPDPWAAVSRFNPFFYMIDGFRYGFLGASDVSPTLSIGVMSAFFVLLSVFCIWLLHTGYKLRD